MVGTQKYIRCKRYSLNVNITLFIIILHGLNNTETLKLIKLSNYGEPFCTAPSSCIITCILNFSDIRRVWDSNHKFCNHIEINDTKHFSFSTLIRVLERTC